MTTVTPLISALTGHLPFILITAALLTWPISAALLAIYTRAVRRSMRRMARGRDESQRTSAGRVLSASAEATARLAEAERRRLDPAPMPPIEVTLIDAAAVNDTVPAASAFLRRLAREPWRTAACYALAGGAYSIVITVALLTAMSTPLLPLRFTTLAWVFAWPTVISVAMVAASVRRVKVALVLAYATIYAVLGIIGVQISPDLTLGQLAILWVIDNGPPTVLLMICLHRRIRAVGTLVLSFLLLALLGADLLLASVGSQDRYMLWAVRLFGLVGLGGNATFVGIIGIGFLAFALVGWGAVSWIRRRYEAKQVSDESVAIDAMWLMFTVVHAMDLVFESSVAVLGAVAAFGAYKITARMLLSRLASRAGEQSPQLLLLRSFSMGHRAEHLFDALEKYWRRVGSIQMIAGYDLAARTIEPHEFLDFLTGKLTRRFIDGEAALERRVGEKDISPDRDGRFRVNDFFCYDDTWRMTFSRLSRSSSVVLMDLRGFSRANAGCVFEIQELFATVDLAEVVFVVDRATDETLLLQVFNQAAALAAARSPELHGGAPRPRLFRFGSIDSPTMRSLLAALAAACSARIGARLEARVTA
jgi:hypothetical protein